MLLDIVKYPQDKLKELIRSRLQGKDAGLPLNEARGEHPMDILINLYEYEGDDAFRKKFASAVVSLREEVKGRLGQLDSKYFRRLVSLVGRLKLQSSLDYIVSLLKESDALGQQKSAENHSAILVTLGVLQINKGLVPYWVKLMEEEPIYAEIAFENVNRVAPEVAARQIPRLALLAKANPTHINLPQLLTYFFLPSQSDDYINDAFAALRENSEAAEAVINALESNESLKDQATKVREAVREAHASKPKKTPITFYTRDNALNTYQKDKNWNPHFPVMSAS